MPFLSHAGVSLRYDRAGAGPAVLLIHGWCFNRTVWERQVSALRDRHTAITVDVRGHGESSHPRSGYTLGALVGDLEHLVRALNVPRIALVGWSMGAGLAVELAARLGERASALALVGAGAPDAKKTAEMKAQIADDFRAFVRQLAPTLFKEGAASPLLSWAVSQMQKTPAHVAAACFDLGLPDAPASLKKLKLPTAVFHGSHDTFASLEDAQSTAKLVKGAKLTVFEESAHAPHLEEPDRFNEALAKLLSD